MKGHYWVVFNRQKSKWTKIKINNNFLHKNVMDVALFVIKLQDMKRRMAIFFNDCSTCKIYKKNYILNPQ